MAAMSIFSIFFSVSARRKYTSDFIITDAFVDSSTPLSRSNLSFSKMSILYIILKGSASTNAFASS